MTKKNREKFFERVRADAERFCPDLNSIEKSEISELLSAVGTDVDALRKRLNESARKLALAQRQKGNKVPAYLQDVIDMTGEPQETAKNPRIAVEKAMKWLDSFLDKVVPVPKEVTVQRAYRRAGDLSRKDVAALDELEEKLKDKVKKEHE
jgi:molybdopterin converting factor small subunit